MNILHLTPDFNYGDGRSYYVYLLLKYLKKNGHNVFICTNGGNSLERFKELGVSVLISQSLSNKSSFLKSLNFVSKILKENDIQILHSHHRYYELLANYLSYFGKRKIYTVVTALSIVDKRYLVEYKSDKIIAVSKSVKDFLIQKFKLKGNKISLIPNFVDSDESSENSKPINENWKSEIENSEAKNGNNKAEIKNRKSKNELVNLLSIGRFHKEKNFETLLNAMCLLTEYKIKLTLIGEGEEKKNYEKTIAKNSLNVEIIPPKRHLKDFFEAADICILPSIRDPLPGFMLQSGLHKKPFIGTNIDGIKDLIIDNVNGLLFEKQNEIEVSNKIKLFIEDKVLAESCARNLNKTVTENYTEKSVIPRIETLYYKLLN